MDAAGSALAVGPTNNPVSRVRAVHNWAVGTAVGNWTVRVLSVLVVLTLWELYGRSLNPILFVPPSAIARSAVNLWFVDQTMWGAISETLWPYAVGLAGATMAGVVVGFLMGRIGWLNDLLDPWVSIIYSIPSIASIPLLVIWFGIGPAIRIAIVAQAVFFLMIVTAKAGVDALDPALVDVARANEASEWQTMRTVVFPGSLPMVMTGVRLCVSEGLRAVIVAEMTAALVGLGGMLIRSANYFRTADLFVPIIAIMVINLLVTDGVKRAHRRLAPWMAEHGPDEV